MHFDLNLLSGKSMSSSSSSSSSSSTALPYRDSNRGLFLYFFGEDSKKRMQLKSFDDFLKGLHDEIVRLEFAHYDFKNQVSKLLEVAKLYVPVMPLSVPAIPFSD